MRIVKLGLISVVFLFVVSTAISLLLPSQVIVSRAIDLSTEADSVHQYLSKVENWSQWLSNADSLQATTSQGVLHIRNTSVRIKEVKPLQITSEWRVGEGKPMDGEMNFITSESASYFTLQWSFNYHVAWYPWEKFASILSDKALGPYMEQSLDNLKKIVEMQAGPINE